MSFPGGAEQGTHSAEAGASELLLLVLMPPVRQLLSKMGLWGLLPFVVPSILLRGVQDPGLVEGFFFRPCPHVRVKCELEELNQCTRSSQCPGRMRCCWFSCGKKCLDVREDACNMPKKIGPCLAYLPRWWYDKETELCTKFIYSGCQGNLNNFQSKAVCTVTCKRKQSTSWIG
ncbi:WAP four-disulfide core domain protein 6A-like [Perognathus longimembris pacificus]|uniref:WAP four-disulfide core domain protein 6A-like n=1 Tax=Perognathus longimembris pacificus TaxID=214514 RepID=UPI002018F0B1|nr:WAP four-disulfide core domain protein 6A-like [Perognathus longimembris pacificus]